MPDAPFSMEGLRRKLDVWEVGKHFVIAFITLQDIHNNLQRLGPYFWQVSLMWLPDWEGENLFGRGKLSIDARLVSSGVNSVPTKFTKVNSVQAVQTVWSATVTD